MAQNFDAENLIVDDDADRAMLAHIFEASGYEARFAPNGREALAYVLDDSRDVTLLDILMPEMDGPFSLEAIRCYLRLQSLPVVLYTGLPGSPMIDRPWAAKDQFNYLERARIDGRYPRCRTRSNRTDSELASNKNLCG